MPIRVPKNLPAIKILEQERILVMDEKRAFHQDIRPLRILILNIMPKKSETETQLIRLLSNTPLQLYIDLLQMSSHDSKHTSVEYLERFYKSFGDIKENYYDGLIITGAPVEQLPFEKVDYWDEMCEVMEWSKTHVFSTVHICWGAQAALYYHYGIPKYSLTTKLTGVFEHQKNDENERIFHGFDDRFNVPHSRYTYTKKADILQHKQLKLLSTSKEAGVFLVKHLTDRQYFVTGHLEYGRMTLADEYQRDLKKKEAPTIPAHYFVKDQPDSRPSFLWKSTAALFFSNWLNHIVYPDTPFELNKLEKLQLEEGDF